ncbi:MAG: hypothetical protein WKG00_41995 [Polyangiaceae bacterium]
MRGDVAPAAEGGEGEQRGGDAERPLALDNRAFAKDTRRPGRAALRDPGFSETGTILTHDPLSPGSSGLCSTGWLTLDTREILQTPQGQGKNASASVHYSYLMWSWIHVAGGGVVRALLETDAAFHRRHVLALELATVTETGQQNGWVKALYGKTRQGGNWIYGWTAHSHQFPDEPVVWHMARMPEYYRGTPARLP